MTHPTELKLPESLEVVAWRKKHDRAYHVEFTFTDRSSAAAYWAKLGDPLEPLVRLSDAESALKARDAEIERLRGVVVETRRVLELENNKGAASAIRDTIWRGPAETLFDYLDAAIDQARAEGGEKEHG